MDILTLRDYLLLPFYFFAICFIGLRVRKRYYPSGHAWRPYFMPALVLKMVASLALCFLYRYYYGNGDLMKYFHTASVVNTSFSDSPAKWFNLITVRASFTDPAYQQYFINMDWYGLRCMNMYVVSTIAAVIGFFTFNTFLNTSIVFAALSFTGVWALFRTFARRYPTIIPYVACAFLFIPSVLLWGSSLSKDTISIFSLGWIVHISFKSFQNRRFQLVDLFLLLLSIIALLYVKPYIFLALLPALLYWGIMSATKGIQKVANRYILRIAILSILTILFVALPAIFPVAIQKYAAYHFIETSENTREIIAQNSLSNPGGSAYRLGKITPTLTGLLFKALPAVNAALFRPYLWESHKLIVALYSSESLLLLFLTIWVIIKRGLRALWECIINDVAVQFCLIFTFAFAFSVGISSYNFGTLSRYRIPCLPFYVLALFLLYFYKRPSQSTSQLD